MPPETQEAPYNLSLQPLFQDVVQQRSQRNHDTHTRKPQRRGAADI